MAKLRHCTKFRCTGVLRRIANRVFGERRGEREGAREIDERREERKISSEKGGQKSERASERATGHPLPGRRDEGGRTRRRMRRPRWRLKQEGQCAARPEAEARAGATGSDLVILSLAIPPSPPAARYCSSALRDPSAPSSIQPSTLNYRPPPNPFVYAFPVEDSRLRPSPTPKPPSFLRRFRFSAAFVSFTTFSPHSAARSRYLLRTRALLVP